MTRDLSDECMGCEHKEKSMTFCFNECAIPVELLYLIERDRLLKKENEAQDGNMQHK